MPANGLASSAKRTGGAGPTRTGPATKPMAAMAATVREGAIHRATAPAAENITSGKLVLQDIERQLSTRVMAPNTLAVRVRQAWGSRPARECGLRSRVGPLRYAAHPPARRPRRGASR